MTPEDLKKRTKAFALRVVRLSEALPKYGAAAVIGKQMLRAETSVGSNYRRACRAQSHRDFVAKMSVVEEECDETAYWLELLIEGGMMSERSLSGLLKEAHEILAIVVASIRTSRAHNEPAPPRARSTIINSQSAIKAPRPSRRMHSRK